MFCHSCGSKQLKEAQFCPNCGTKILKTEQAASIEEIAPVDVSKTIETESKHKSTWVVWLLPCISLFLIIAGRANSESNWAQVFYIII